MKDPIGEVRWLIQGIWDSYLDILKVTNEVNTGENARFETDTPIRIWTINSPVYVFAENLFLYLISLSLLQNGNWFQSVRCKLLEKSHF